MVSVLIENGICGNRKKHKEWAMKRFMDCRLGALLVAGVGASLLSALTAAGAEEHPFAAAAAPVSNGWTAGRFKDETIEGKPVVRLSAGTAYGSAKVTGNVPNTGYVILKVRYYTTGGDLFSIGLGAWGSPVQTVAPAGPGWQTEKLGFPAATAAQLITGGCLPMIIQKAGAKDPALAGVEVYVPSREELLAIYRDYVRKNTAEAFRMGRAGEGGLSYVEDYDNKEPLAPSAEDTQRGAMPFLRTYLKDIYPASVPSKAERLLESKMRLTPGETRPLQFGVKALEDLPECHAEVTSQLPAGLTVDIRWIESVPVRCQGGSSSKKWHVQPYRLWPAAIFPTCAVKAKDAQGFYALFHAADGLKPQVVPVEITVKNGTKSILTHRVFVTVLPFTLPRQLDAKFLLTSPGLVEDDDTLADLAEHGCNGLATFNNAAPAIGERVDFSKWDACFAKYKKYGVDSAFFWYLGNPTGGNSVKDGFGREAFLSMLKGLDERVKDGRYPKFFCVTIDEAVNSGKAMSALRELSSMVKSNAPSLKIMGGALDRISNTRKYSPDWIDFIACNGSFAENRDWCRQNKVLLNTYTYVAARIGASSPRVNYGLHPWRFGAFAVNGWALDWNNGSPFNDLDGGMSDWCILLPNWLGRPISTPAWEGFREGVNDRRYAAVLEKLVKEGKAKGEVLDEIREKGLEGMNFVAEKVVGDSVFGAEVTDADKVELARDRIIDEILKAMGPAP